MRRERPPGPSSDAETVPPTRADVERLLAAEATAATPALVRRLQERVQALARTDARAATDLAEGAAVVAEACADAVSLALAHRARAVAALARGSRRAALRHYEEAERLYGALGDDVARAGVLRSMMDPLMHLGRHGEALATGREAREVFERHGLDVLAAQVDANAGNVLHLLERHRDALAAYRRATATFRRAAEAEAVAMMEHNAANALANLYRLAEAERGYRRALRFYRARAWRLREAQCLYGLANVAQLEGRTDAALRLLHDVRELDRELGDERHAALCELDRAELMLGVNAWREAALAAGGARRVLERLGLVEEAGRAMLAEGLADLHRDHLERADDLFESAARGSSLRANDAGRALATLYRAEVALRRGAFGDAERGAAAAASFFRRSGIAGRAAYALVVAARGAAGGGRTTAARRRLAGALRLLELAPSASVGWQVDHLLGTLSHTMTARRAHLRRAVEQVERLRSAVTPDELRASFGRDKAALFEDAAACALEGPDPRLAEAFELVEGGKARALGDALIRRRRRGRVRAGELDFVLDSLNAAYRRLNELERDAGSAAEAGEVRREIAARETRVAELVRLAQLRAGASESEKAEALPAVRARLAADEALVELFALRGRLHALVLRRDDLRWLPEIAALPAVARLLERWAFHVETLLHGPAHVSARRASLAAAGRVLLRELWRSVWEPIAPALTAARRLVVVPTGALFRLPFHALLAEDRFLVETHEVSQAPSARAFAAAHARRRAARRPPLVVGVERPELPSIEAELHAVAELLPGARVLRGAAAARSAVRRHSRGARVLHLAAHAEFRGDAPLLSSLELADGRLSFYDLCDLRLDVDLVVLSGCRTGLQRVLEGDELMGLARGFALAGAGSVLASLWPVGDEETAGFMRCFYRALAAGGGPRAALAAAMRERIAEGALPLEWAAFHLSGRPGRPEASGGREEAR